MKHKNPSLWKSLGVLLLSLSLALLSVGQATDTKTLYQAIRDDKVAVKVTGSGIRRVVGRVTRPARSEPMLLTIPIGTLFVAGSGGVQNMVTVSPTTVDLRRTRVAGFAVAVACSNIDLDIPTGEDEFSVEESPEQEDLQTLLPTIRRGRASFAVTQAAVWIITDDADYEGLGTLTESFGGFGGGSRVINEPEVARAMMLIEQANLNLSERSIWADRVDICQGIRRRSRATQDIRSWCSRVLRETE